MAFLTPQASALAGLRYAPNHWNGNTNGPVRGFNHENSRNSRRNLFWDLRRSRGAAEFSATVLSVAPAGLDFLVALTRS